MLKTTLTLICIITCPTISHYGMDFATDDLKKESKTIEKKLQTINEQIAMYEAMNGVLSYEIQQIQKKLNLSFTTDQNTRFYTQSLIYKVTKFRQNTTEINRLKQELLNTKEKIQELLMINTMLLESFLLK
jgi:predicted RNase H-like nuclease (RuvC/YqgF family)